MPFFTNPVNQSQTEIPDEILCNGKKLTYFAKKTAGWSVGGWYKDEEQKEYLAKFEGRNNFSSYKEKMLNDLARICVEGEFVAPEVEIGYGEIDQETQICLLTLKIENYQDLINVKAESKKESDAVLLRKTYAQGLHRFYVFEAFIGNDDLNEENLGIISSENSDEKTPIIIDYGITPTFLYPQQIAHAATPFYLASFIGHRNLNLTQFVRRRYFGHDEFLSPKDRLKPQKDKLKPEDISYCSILDGAKKIIEEVDKIQAVVLSSVDSVMQDETLTEEKKEEYKERYSKFAEILAQRAEWMKENFADDLKNISDQKERARFQALKWRLHPKFLELMQIEEEVFKQCAKKDLDENLSKFSELLPAKTREEILELDLRNVEKSDLAQLAKENFMLHNAIAAGDFKMAKWLVENDIGDINQARNLRNHNYQLFRTTPLACAIAFYHDALFYEKQSDLQPLREIIDVLKEKFIEKNGDKFDQSKKDEYKKAGSDIFAIEYTFKALANYKAQASKEAIAATTIQRAFRVVKLSREIDSQKTADVGHS